MVQNAVAHPYNTVQHILCATQPYICLWAAKGSQWPCLPFSTLEVLGYHWTVSDAAHELYAHARWIVGLVDVGCASPLSATDGAIRLGVAEPWRSIFEHTLCPMVGVPCLVFFWSFGLRRATLRGSWLH